MKADFEILFRAFIMDLYPKVYGTYDYPDEKQLLLDRVNKIIDETEQFLNSLKEQQAVLANYR